MSHCSSRESVKGYQWKIEIGGTASKYDYDVFIAYSPDDHTFVLNNIIKQLDQHFSGQFHCCYEYKDFLPGSHRIDCVMEAMDRSYKTFLVMSHSYVENGLGEFICKMNFEAQYRNRVVPIKIDDCQIPGCMQQYMILDFTTMTDQDFYDKLKKIVKGTKLYPLNGETPGVGGVKGCCSARSRTHSVHSSSQGQGQAAHVCSWDQVTADPPYMNTGEYESPECCQTDDRISRSHSLHSRPSGYILDKWSKESFHDNPSEFVLRFSQADQTSPLFYDVEQMLLQEVLASDQVSMVNLAHLTCCRGHGSAPVKKQALIKLERSILRDDMGSDTCAEDLKHAEEIIRLSLGHYFRYEPVQFQTLRMQAYGCIIYYSAMHIERKNLTVLENFLSLTESASDIISQLLINVNLLTPAFEYQLNFTKSALQYLSQLYENLKNGIRADSLSDKIDQISRVTNFENYTPWAFLNRALDKEQMWFHMDVIIKYFGSMVFQTADVIHVILKNLHLLLPKRKKVRPVCQYGVVFSISKLLVEIIVKHPERDTRLLAMFGHTKSKKSSGLKHVTDCFLFQDIPEFAPKFKELVQPLLYRAKDDEIIHTVIELFFLSENELKKPRRETATLNEEKVLETVKQHLSSHYEYSGKLLTFAVQCNVTCTTSGFLMLPGMFCGKDVQIKFLHQQQVGNFVSTLYSAFGHSNRLKHEGQVLQGLQHSNIIRLLEFSEKTQLKPLHLMIEHMNRGNLLDFLLKQRYEEHYIGIPHLFSMCNQICSAVEHLTHKGYIHRDICARNVLVSYNPNANTYTCKLTGFSMSVHFQPHRMQDIFVCESNDNILLRHSAPESVLSNHFSYSSDIWMFGCLMFEVLTYGCPPFPECRRAKDVQNILHHGHTLQQCQCIPDLVFLLILKCLARDPNRRPDCKMLKIQLAKITKEICQDPLLDLYGHKGNMILPQPPQGAMDRRADQNLYGDTKSNSSKPDLPGQQRDIEMNGSYVKKPIPQKRKKDAEREQRSSDVKMLPHPDNVDVQWQDFPVTEGRINFNSTHPNKVTLVNVEKTKITASHKQLWEALHGLNHNSLARVFAIEQKGPEYYMVSEYPSCNNGTLLEYILKHQSDISCVNTTTVIHAMVQVAEGLSYLHSRNILHRDIKPPYIYLEQPPDAKGNVLVKLGRFSRSRLMFKGCLDQVSTVLGSEALPLDSLRWCPPEVLSAPSFYSCAGDIYSYAVAFWLLLYALQVTENPDYACIVPYPDVEQDRQKLHEHLLLGGHLAQPYHCPDWLYVMLKKCWRERIKRPPLELIIETLTSRKPFESTLLQGFAQRCRSNPYYNLLNINITQPDRCPYVINHQLPNDHDQLEACLCEYYEEEDTFYENGSAFGACAQDSGQDTEKLAHQFGETHLREFLTLEDGSHGSSDISNCYEEINIMCPRNNSMALSDSTSSDIHYATLDMENLSKSESLPGSANPSHADKGNESGSTQYHHDNFNYCQSNSSAVCEHYDSIGQQTDSAV